MKSTRRGLTHDQRGEARDIARRERKVPRSITEASLPARGEEDAYGQTFSGLPPDRLAAELLAGEEGLKLHHLQDRPAYMDDLGLPQRIRSLHDDVKLTRENIAGEVVGGGNLETGSAQRRWFGPGDSPDIPGGVQVPVAQLRGAGRRIGADLLPEGTKIGPIKGTDIAANAVRRSELAPGAVGDDEVESISWSKLKNDTIPKFAGRQYVDTTDANTRAWVRANYRPK